MGDQVHIADCPGCAADALTDADREHLEAHGWTQPPHVYLAPPELAPPEPPRLHSGQKGVLGCAAVVLGLLLLGKAPWLLLAVVVGVTVAAGTRRWYHRTRHARSGRLSLRCGLCKRARRNEAARLWTDYQRLIEQQNRRRHAFHYQRLQQQEQQSRPDQ